MIEVELFHAFITKLILCAALIVVLGTLLTRTGSAKALRWRADLDKETAESERRNRKAALARRIAELEEDVARPLETSTETPDWSRVKR